MDESQSTNYRIQPGDTVELSNIVTIPGILQLSFGKTYEVVNVGRANNPLNDHIYVRNDHGRVVAYLARLLKKVDNSYLVLTEQGLFKGVMMVYVNTLGARLIILALPEYRVSLRNELAGFVVLDETGFHTEGKFDTYFDRNLFEEIR